VPAQGLLRPLRPRRGHHAGHGSVSFFHDAKIIRYVKEIALLLIWISALVIAIGTTARQIRPSARIAPSSAAGQAGDARAGNSRQSSPVAGWRAGWR